MNQNFLSLWGKLRQSPIHLSVLRGEMETPELTSCSGVWCSCCLTCQRLKAPCCDCISLIALLIRMIHPIWKRGGTDQSLLFISAEWTKWLQLITQVSCWIETTVMQCVAPEVLRFYWKSHIGGRCQFYPAAPQHINITTEETKVLGVNCTVRTIHSFFRWIIF